MENFNLFADKIKRADAEINIMEVHWEDELGYVNKDIQTQTEFNGFTSVVNYEADLRIAYALMMDEIKRKLNGINNVTDKILFLEDYVEQLSKLRLISYCVGKNPERYGHKKFTSKINNHTDYPFQETLSESSVWEYLAVNYQLLDHAIDFIKNLEKGVAADKASDLFSEAPTELISNKPQKIRLDISVSKLAVLIKLLETKGKIITPVKDFRGFVVKHISTLETEDISRNHLKTDISSPEDGAIEYWEDILKNLKIDIANCIKDLENLSK
jgi:hypothetical protein